jgi:hypothetical protein
MMICFQWQNFPQKLVLAKEEEEEQGGEKTWDGVVSIQIDD